MHHGRIAKTTARGLKVLQERIDAAAIPSSKLDETLNIATWNIREFGRKPRLTPSLHYIAEIIGQFDLVALVELRDDVNDLGRVLGYLGPYWRVIYSDYLRDGGGNHERIAYVYDERACEFTGLASHALPRRNKQGAEYVNATGWWRNPYMASFRAGSFDFVVVCVHIRWGDNATSRLPELALLARWVQERRGDPNFTDSDLIVVGDFNIPSRTSALFAAITRCGLKIPAALLGEHGSNLGRDRSYDQILHDATYLKSFTNHGGVLDFYAGDHQPLFPEKKLTKAEFTYQLSDHLPLWIQINTDTDRERLDQTLNAHFADQST